MAELMNCDCGENDEELGDYCNSVGIVHFMADLLKPRWQGFDPNFLSFE